MKDLHKQTIKAFEITIKKYENMEEPENWLHSKYCAFCLVGYVENEECEGCPLSKGHYAGCTDSEFMREFQTRYNNIKYYVCNGDYSSLKPYALKRAKQLKRKLTAYKKEIGEL